MVSIPQVFLPRQDAAKEPGMAFVKRKLESDVQSLLVTVAHQVREKLYSETSGVPKWGTRFVRIESDGMSVGLELARLNMEQALAEQAAAMPSEAREVPDEVVDCAGSRTARLQTEAGVVCWQEPRKQLKRSRKAFFPPKSGSGSGD
jgi:hypothetical protein